VLESNQAARILTVRIPGTSFYAVLRLYESHKAYEKDLARLKAHEGSIWKGFQNGFLDKWRDETARWMVFVDDGWVPREKFRQMEEEEEEEGELYGEDDRCEGVQMMYWTYGGCGKYGEFEYEEPADEFTEFI
jgi:hypothetical protein